MRPPTGATPDVIDCRGVARVLQAFLDREIAGPRAVAVAGHLEWCAACGIEAAAYRWLKAAVASLAQVDDVRRVARLQAFADALADGEQC